MKIGDEWFQDLADGPELVVVPAGRFKMGSTAAQIAALAGATTDSGTGAFSDGAGAHPMGAEWWQTEAPQHEVTLPRPFAIGRNAITRGQFAAFVKDTGLETQSGAYVWRGDHFERDATASWRAPGFPQDDTHPVVCVSWFDANAYAAWASHRTCQTYRLPSEAEREYAARAGTTSHYWWGAASSKDKANYAGKGTAPVASFTPNPWGLHNVHGNIWEWCADSWHDSYTNAPTDGAVWTTATTPADAARRVIRGGSWVLGAQLLRSANRLYNPAVERSHDLGFRLVREL